MWAQLSFVLSQITRLTEGHTGRQTDTFLVASPRWHSVQRGKKVDSRLEALQVAAGSISCNG